MQHLTPRDILWQHIKSVFDTLKGHNEVLFNCLKTNTPNSCDLGSYHTVITVILFIVCIILCIRIICLLMFVMRRVGWWFVLNIIMMIYGVGGLFRHLGVLLRDVMASKNSVRLNCWHCNSNVRVTTSIQNSWRCPHCEQYNGFTEDGGYNAGPDVVYGAVKHDIVPIGLTDQGCNESILCPTCQYNQSRWLQLRSAFEPTSEESFDNEASKFDSDLAERTTLCSKCSRKVRDAIDNADRHVAQVNLYRALKRSKNESVSSISDHKLLKYTLFTVYWVKWGLLCVLICHPYIPLEFQQMIAITSTHLLYMDITLFFLMILSVWMDGEGDTIPQYLSLVFLCGVSLSLHYWTFDMWLFVVCILNVFIIGILDQEDSVQVYEVKRRTLPQHDTNISSPTLHNLVVSENDVPTRHRLNPFSASIKLDKGGKVTVPDNVDVGELLKGLDIQQQRSLWEIVWGMMFTVYIVVVPFIGQHLVNIVEWTRLYAKKSITTSGHMAKEGWMWAAVGLTAAMRLLSSDSMLLKLHIGALSILALHYAVLAVGESPSRRASFLSNRSNFVRDTLVTILLGVLLWRGLVELMTPSTIPIEQPIFVQGERIVWKSTTPTPSPTHDTDLSVKIFGSETVTLVSAVAMAVIRFRDLL